MDAQSVLVTILFVSSAYIFPRLYATAKRALVASLSFTPRSTQPHSQQHARQLSHSYYTISIIYSHEQPVISVTRCQSKKHPQISHKLPKKQPQHFLLKRGDFLKNPQKLTNIFCNFQVTFCCQNFSKQPNRIVLPVMGVFNASDACASAYLCVNSRFWMQGSR